MTFYLLKLTEHNDSHDGFRISKKLEDVSTPSLVPKVHKKD